MKNKKTIIALSICCILVLLVGSLAFFTDRESQITGGKAGNIDLVFTDESLASKSTASYAQDKVWENGSLVSNGGILNPGDTVNMDFKVENTGNKSIDVRLLRYFLMRTRY